MTDLQALLGNAVDPRRYSDDDDVVEAHLVRSLDRWGDRMVPKDHSHPMGRHNRVERDANHDLYEAELARIDRRLQSRGSQGRD